MRKEFSLKYGENPLSFSADKSTFYEIDCGVTVDVSLTEYKEFDAYEWVLNFENKSSQNSKVISDICDCDTLLPLDLPPVPRVGWMPKVGDVCVITMTGMVEGEYYWENDKVSATEYAFNHEYLDKAPECKKSFANICGRSSEGMMPFFDVTASGAGYITAIGWTGDWKSTFKKEDGGVRMQTGLKETAFYLKPGEKLRTTSILIMKYDNAEEKHNKFRRLVKKHFSLKSTSPTTRESIMAVELWGGLTSEEIKKRIRELKEYDIRFEDVWLDAGWYGQCTKCDDAFSGDWFKHTGDWNANRRVHPNGLEGVAECAEDAGMNMMLWIEPERAVDTTPIMKEHPEWFMKRPEDNYGLLNYGNEDALDYAINVVSSYVKKLNMSCYRQDFNIPTTEIFKYNDEEGRRGISEIKHITGLYKFWDALIKRHPHLLIDNCSGGGRRIDIESLKRSIPFFRSDYQCNFNENPDVLQVHNATSLAYLPYVGCTSKTKGDTYAIRSSFASSWGGAFYNAIFQSMSDEDFRWAKKVTDEYRRIRKYFSKDFYNHASSVLDDTSWAIFQYHDAETESGIVMAFRRENSPFDTVNITLRGLSEDKLYTFENLDSGITSKGGSPLVINLPRKRSCTIFEYKSN